MSKFAKYLEEKIDRSDVARINRVSGVKSSDETVKNVSKGPEAVIRRLFSQENIEKDITDYMRKLKAEGKKLEDDGELVMFMNATQDLISKINKSSDKK
jgi:hypothetical protein